MARCYLIVFNARKLLWWSVGSLLIRKKKGNFSQSGKGGKMSVLGNGSDFVFITFGSASSCGESTVQAISNDEQSTVQWNDFWQQW